MRHECTGCSKWLDDGQVTCPECGCTIPPLSRAPAPACAFTGPTEEGRAGIAKLKTILSTPSKRDLEGDAERRAIEEGL